MRPAPVEPRTKGGDELSMYFLSGAEGKVSAERVIAAAVENDDQLKFARIILLEVSAILAQHRPNAVFLIVGRN